MSSSSSSSSSSSLSPSSATSGTSLQPPNVTLVNGSVTVNLPALPIFDPNKLKLTHRLQERGALVYLARLAEKAERFDDVLRLVNSVVRLAATAAPGSSDADLTDDERQLLFISYKHIMYSLRNSWKGSRYDEWNKFNDVIDEYKSHVEREIVQLASDLVNLLENALIKNVAKNESKVYFMKMAGDYYRYLAEVQPIKGYERRALDLYNQGYRLATSTLPPNHPSRLQTALNYSVCLYEIFRDKKQAVEVAKTAFDLAIQKLDELEEAAYKDATLIMQLIRDNLTLWTQADQQQQEAK